MANKSLAIAEIADLTMHDDTLINDHLNNNKR